MFFFLLKHYMPQRSPLRVTLITDIYLNRDLLFQLRTAGHLAGHCNLIWDALVGDSQS